MSMAEVTRGNKGALHKALLATGKETATCLVNMWGFRNSSVFLF